MSSFEYFQAISYVLGNSDLLPRHELKLTIVLRDFTTTCSVIYQHENSVIDCSAPWQPLKSNNENFCFLGFAFYSYAVNTFLPNSAKLPDLKSSICKMPPLIPSLINTSLNWKCLEADFQSRIRLSSAKIKKKNRLNP